jgi:trk system potassium uptake protein TrkA
MNVVIAGGGKVGMQLAAMLLKRGDGVKLVEPQPERLTRLKRELPANVLLAGSASDPAVLEQAGIRGANVVAAVTGADEVNLVVSSLARFEFDVPRVIARVNNPKNAWLFTPEMGVDVMLNQADLMGHLIVEEMSLGDMMTLLKLRKGQYSLVEEKVHPQSGVVGKALADLDLPAECALAAIIRRGDLVIPHADTVLEPADEVLAVVHRVDIARLAALLGKQAGAVMV